MQPTPDENHAPSFILNRRSKMQPRPRRGIGVLFLAKYISWRLMPLEMFERRVAHPISIIDQRPQTRSPVFKDCLNRTGSRAKHWNVMQLPMLLKHLYHAT